MTAPNSNGHAGDIRQRRIQDATTKNGSGHSFQTLAKCGKRSAWKLFENVFGKVSRAIFQNIGGSFPLGGSLAGI